MTPADRVGEERGGGETVEQESIAVTEDMVERGARAAVWAQFMGCVSWEDTDDTATTGDVQTRAYARDFARAVLTAALTSVCCERDYVSRQYHMHVIEALVAERDAARAALAKPEATS